MRGWRLAIASTASLVVALAAVAAPPAADAGSPLLSGYGGPGAGSQAILGSALLGGPSSGGGAGGSGTTTGSGGQRPATGTAGGAGAGGTHAGAGAGAHGGSSARGGKASTSAGTPTGGARPLEQARGSSAATSAGYSQTLGLSGADLVYVLFALGALVLTGVLTRMLVRQPGQARGSR